MPNLKLEENLVQTILSIAIGAGELILSYYKGDIAVINKDDNTPVTAADYASNDYIIKELKKIANDIPIVSEENNTVDNKYIIENEEVFWLIDPLDGTKSFAKKEEDFVVSIALIKKGKPIFGVIYIPVEDSLFYAQQDNGCFKKIDNEFVRIYANLNNIESKAISSTRGVNQQSIELLNKLSYTLDDMILVSSAKKFCMMAEGKAKLYLHFCPTSIWDSAAGHIISEEAGCKIMDSNMEDISYNHGSFDNPYFMVVNHDFKDELLKVMESE